MVNGHPVSSTSLATIRDYHNDTSGTGVDHGHDGNQDYEVVARAQLGNREVHPR